MASDLLGLALLYIMTERRLRQPAEWESHNCIWTAWPSHPDLWEAALDLARREVASLVQEILDSDEEGQPRGEIVRILAKGEEAVASARRELDLKGVEIIPMDFGDIWLRDTGPIFVDAEGSLAASRFRFNGWGGKYDLPGDDEVAMSIIQTVGVDSFAHEFVLEGGAIEADGEGTLLTTEECLLNPNRNPGLKREQIEERLRLSLGARKIIWLERGLVEDHTDGHIDNVARFVAPGKVVCQTPSGGDDPNAHILAEIEQHLRASTDAEGRTFEVLTIPSPGRVEDTDGKVMAASHMNFLITNTRVIVPVYNDVGEKAVAKLQKLFPDREVVGLPSRHILLGGGSFHCITQPQPSLG